MTKEEFKDLQLNMQQSGMSVKEYLQHVGTIMSIRGTI